MAVIKVTQVIDTDTSLNEIREFVKLTEHIDGELLVAEYEENGDLVGLEIVMSAHQLNDKG